MYVHTWPKVTLLLLNWNGRHLLETCLPSLLATDYDDFELLLVDNGSQDDSLTFVRQRFPKVRLIENIANLGFAGGMNVGLRQANGDVLLLVNTDVTVHPGWLRALVAALEADPAIGIAGCKVYYPDGCTLQHAGGIINYPQALPDHWGHKQLDEGQHNALREVDYVIGAALALRRDLLDAVGYLDEGFFLYYEDPDYCFRARAAGYKVVYVPDAVIIHDESSSSVPGSYGYQFHFHRSRLRFVLKHYAPEQVVTDFAPAEAAWLAQLSGLYTQCALHQAYLKAMLIYPGLYDAFWYTNSAPGSFEAVIDALSLLRGQVWGKAQGETFYD